MKSNIRKSVSNGYVLGVGYSDAEQNVTQAEYDLITQRMNAIPEAPEGKIVVLLDGTYEWTFVDTPEEATEEDYISALAELGVNLNEEENT